MSLVRATGRPTEDSDRGQEGNKREEKRSGAQSVLAVGAHPLRTPSGLNAQTTPRYHTHDHRHHQRQHRAREQHTRPNHNHLHHNQQQASICSFITQHSAAHLNRRELLRFAQPSASATPPVGERDRLEPVENGVLDRRLQAQHGVGLIPGHRFFLFFSICCGPATKRARSIAGEGGGGQDFPTWERRRRAGTSPAFFFSSSFREATNPGGRLWCSRRGGGRKQESKRAPGAFRIPDSGNFLEAKNALGWGPGRLVKGRVKAIARPKNKR